MKKLFGLIITFLLILCSVLPARPAVFTDIDNHWAQQDIQALWNKDIINGDGSGRFYPEDPISRQEMIALLVRFAGLDRQPNKSEIGSSIASNAKGVSSWAVPSLNLAQSAGFLSDNEIRTLNWGQSATRQEVAVWLSKTLRLTPVTSDAEHVLYQFRDAGNISLQFAPYIIPLVKIGVMTGSNGYFRPFEPIRRAEVAVVLNRANDSINGGTVGQTLSIIGEVQNINRNTGILEVYSNGSRLSYQFHSSLMTSSSSSSINNIYTGDEVALTVQNGWITSVKVINGSSSNSSRSSTSNSDDYILYKGTLDSVDNDQKGIILTSVYYLEDGTWYSKSGHRNLDLDSNADVYYDGDEIDLDDLEDYENNTIYLAYDEDEDEVVKIRIKHGSESRYSDTVKDVRSSYLKLEDYGKVDYDDSSIVIEDGELKEIDDIRDDDDLYLIINKYDSTDYAAVIEISSNGSSNYNNSDDYIIYKGTLDSVDNDQKGIVLASVYYFEDGTWYSKSGSRNLDLDRNVDIYYDGDDIDLDDLEDYEDDTIYLAYDDDEDEVVKIRVKHGSESRRSDTVEDVRSSYLKLEDYDNAYYDDSTIVIEDGELKEADDIRDDDDLYLVINEYNSTDCAAVIEIR